MTLGTPCNQEQLSIINSLDSSAVFSLWHGTKSAFLVRWHTITNIDVEPREPLLGKSATK
jgi:hypothetical protein